MKTNIVAPAGGLAILAGGLALAFYTATYTPALQETKNKTVQKYLAQAEKALKKGDKKEAEKFVKKAIAVDPKNKKALAEFKKIALLDCTNTPQTSTQTTKPTTQPKAQPEAESEDEMGCI